MGWPSSEPMDEGEQVEQAAPVLEARALEKRFGGVVALRGVDLYLFPGEVLALGGENGAGKSTLIKILSGVHPAGSFGGRLQVEGRDAEFADVSSAARAGIAVIHQELALVPELSVAENIYLGDEPGRWGWIDRDAMAVGATRLLARFGLKVAVETRVADLGVGQQQLVEIAKALRKDSKVLILDEPTAALADHEVDVLLRIVRELRERDVACIYISHKLDEVFALADRVTVLRDGASVRSAPTNEWTESKVIRAMVGRPVTEIFPTRRAELGQATLNVESLSVADEESQTVRLADVSFQVRAGEVLGIGGLMGSGRSELLAHVFGLWGRRLSGRVSLGHSDLVADPAAAVRAGVVFVTEDRKRYGLVLDQTVGFNLSLSALGSLCRWGVVQEEAELGANTTAKEQLQVKAQHLETRVRTLSGGNQQKVVLGKALMTKPRVVLLDEPTRGIDVGAKQEIYQLIHRLSGEGLAVVLVSSELPELLGLSHRIIMLAEGRTTGEFDAASVDQQTLLEAAMGRGPKTRPSNEEVSA